MSVHRLAPGLLAAAAASVLSACVVAPPAVRTEVRYVQVPAPAPAPVPAPVAAIDPPAAVVSVYVDPPLVQPAPIAVEFAPPPMLVQVPPPPPFDEAVWIGGYWGWQGRWVWCSGRWAPPPQPGYVWTHPYYENRDGAVVFVAGFWRAPMVAFVPPPPGRLSLEITLGGVVGVRPIGPPGVFVPPPPGSRMGIVVPAPIGTAPAVVVSAPPVVNVGMRVQAGTSIDSHDVTRINQTSVNNITNVKNVTNVTNVTIVAPPGATASGKAFQGNVPAVAHLAAAQPATVHMAAPPATATLPTYTAGHAPPSLPPPQALRAAAPAAARPAQAEPMPVRGASGQGPESAVAMPSPTPQRSPSAQMAPGRGPASVNAAEGAESAGSNRAAVPAPAEQQRAAQQREQQQAQKQQAQAQKQQAQQVQRQHEQQAQKKREQQEHEAEGRREKAKPEHRKEEM